jgi:hypothetical protein
VAAAVHALVDLCCSVGCDEHRDAACREAKHSTDSAGTNAHRGSVRVVTHYGIIHRA